MASTHTQELDDKSAEALQHILDLTDRHGGMIAHDLSDPLDAEYLKWVWEGHGKTPERYPGLFGMIAHDPEWEAGDRALTTEDLPGDPAGDFKSGQIIGFIGAIESGQYAGKTSGLGTFTRTKEIASAYVSLMVINYPGGGASPKVLASGHETSYGAPTLQVLTEGKRALPRETGGETLGVLSWAVLYTDKTRETSTQKFKWNMAALGAAEDPHVEAPVQNSKRTKGDKTAIVIGLSRGFNSSKNNTDIDYWFWRNQFEKTELLVPLEGYVKFTHTLAPLGPNNPDLMFGLSRFEGGEAEVEPNSTRMQHYQSLFTIDPNDSTKLNFKLQASETEEQNAINFGKSPWVADTRTFLTIWITVAFNDSQLPVGMASIVSSTKEDLDPTDGVAHIKPLKFVWHCLAAGTQITVADGTTKAIETIEVGEELRSGTGTRKVLANYAQPHWGDVFVVSLTSGKTITCSGTHPVMASVEGRIRPTSAAQLTVGQTVEVDGGTDTITSVTTQQMSGEGLFNLELERQPGEEALTTMLAGGIWVGDYQMQVELLELERKDPERMRARLPEDLLRDYESHLEDISLASKA